MNEQNTQIKYEGEVVTQEGLGFGEGDISVVKRLEDPEDNLTPEVMDKVGEILTGENALVPKESDDDGCPDGRNTGRILKGLTFVRESLIRAKVFGGGLTMGVSARIGLGKAKTGLKKLFSSESEEFERAGLEYGGHTATGSTGPKSGCGAIDESPAIVSNAPVYRDKIKVTLGVFGSVLEDFDINVSDTDADEVIDNYQEYKEEYIDEDYAGKEVMEEELLEKQKIVKELEGSHLEVAIAINTVKGMTVDQELIRSETDGAAQVFALDLWRIVEIAEKRYDDPRQRARAVVSMLVYSLSTAATLTDGTLPVYLIKPSEEKAEQTLAA